jgi:transposase
MSRRQKDPLRPLTDDEQDVLRQISRALNEPASHVARAKILLAVAAGNTYTAAAQAAGRRSDDAVAELVARFNREGLTALQPRHGGGAHRQYAAEQATRILTEVERTPDRERDGTATWSLTTLQQALRNAEDGLPSVSTFTIWCVLHNAGYSWQKTRSWCPTGSAIRKRKDGQVAVTDRDTEAKKT